MTIVAIAHASPQVIPRPFLKWAGGKSKLIEQYSAYFPRVYKTYYEPFLGGGAIFFHLRPDRAMLMDINPELVNVYCCIRDSVDSVIGLLKEHQQNHSLEYYYQVRSSQYEDPIDRAARLIYLNKTCFNGLYRENSKGEFNVPMGNYKKPAICTPELLRAASLSLQSTDIVVRPFAAVLEMAKPDDFVYFDPPYHPISATSNFTGYNRYAFTAEDQRRLRDTFAALVARGVKVLLSNSDCPFIRDLYAGFSIHTMLANRAINSKGDRRGKISEVLITSA
jgi:DNA adenine methylase